MPSKFHLFIGSGHYPRDGLGDYDTSFDTLEEAIEKANKNLGRKYDNDWAHIIITNEDGFLETVWSNFN